MKKFLTLMLVVFVSIAIFAATEESTTVEATPAVAAETEEATAVAAETEEATPAVVEEVVVEDKLVDISGTVGFSLMVDEAGLNLAPYFSPKIVFEQEVAGGTFKATFGPSVTTKLYVVDSTGSTPATWDPDAGKYYYKDDFGTKHFVEISNAASMGYSVGSSIKTFSLNSVVFDTDAWSLTAAPGVVGLSTYTIGGFTPAEAALQLNLKDYGLKLELVDSLSYTNEVTPHATGTFGLPRFWHLGARYDFDVSGVAGSVAGAYKFDDATNNRIAIEANLTEVPVPGSLSADLVFGLLNYGDDTTDDSTSAYRVDVAYKYPLEMDPVTVTPHVGFTWQNNLKTVYAEEFGKDLMAVYYGLDSAWADTLEVTVGADLSYLAKPLTVELTDKLTIDLLEAAPVFALSLTPAVDYAISDLSSVGVEVPVKVTDLTDFSSTLSITPHGYLTYGMTEVPVTLTADVYYFFEKGKQAENPIAYMADVTYKFNDYVSAGLHAGNERWMYYFGAPVKVNGADPLTDLHWNLYLNGELEF